MPNLKSNKREIAIYQKYKNLGYECLKKGWPDFCFFKDNGIFEVVFVEVKRVQRKETLKSGFSKHQKRMIEILKKLNLKVIVERV